MIIDGFFDWASERVPGPPDKHYGQQDEHKGIVCHSMAGSYVNALARLMGPDRASWKGSILLDGRLIQHYPMDYSTWTSGAPVDNIAFDAFETEGAQPELFTDAQIATWARIIRELSQTYGWTPRRPTDADDLTATCWEHNEMVRFGSSPTACPDGRADWPRMMAGGRMYTDEEIDAKVGAALALGVRNQENLAELANGQDVVISRNDVQDATPKLSLKGLWFIAGKAWPF